MYGIQKINYSIIHDWEATQSKAKRRKEYYKKVIIKVQNKSVSFIECSCICCYCWGVARCQKKEKKKERRKEGKTVKKQNENISCYHFIREDNSFFWCLTVIQWVPRIASLNLFFLFSLLFFFIYPLIRLLYCNKYDCK